MPATPRGGVEEKPQEESSVEKTAVEEEDLLPEVTDEELREQHSPQVVLRRSPHSTGGQC